MTKTIPIKVTVDTEKFRQDMAQVMNDNEGLRETVDRMPKVARGMLLSDLLMSGDYFRVEPVQHQNAVQSQQGRGKHGENDSQTTTR